MREAWWSASVMGRPWNQAAGLPAAWRRSATATRPKSSLVAPCSCMYRLANIATQWAGVRSPKGAYQPKWTWSAVGAATRPWIPAPKRFHDRPLRAR